MPLPPYNKPHLSVPDQLALLEKRGMAVTDRPRAIQYLERIGYYRLSGYWHPLRKTVPAGQRHGRPAFQFLDEFLPGVTFSQAVELYVFDKRLRLLFLDAIERIEVALRVQVALLLSSRDPWAHRDPSQLDGNFARVRDSRTGWTKFESWLARVDAAEQRSKEDFVTHFRARYSSDLPMWVAIELWDFGTLSTFLAGMKFVDQQAIAARYSLRRELLLSWVRSINYVRNVCAHHARLWNMSPVDYPRPPRVGEMTILDHLAHDPHAQSRLYAVAVAVQLFLRTVNPTTSWNQRLKELLAGFPAAPGAVIGQSGFPPSWENLPLWN
jgi:abortive infection bacteriophage resistance protein